MKFKLSEHNFYLFFGTKRKEIFIEKLNKSRKKKRILRKLYTHEISFLNKCMRVHIFLES